MIYLRLFYEFFKTGLFAVGGGLATLPFLYEISERTGWFSTADITNMFAVSESTPGPIGINMSTYVGFQTGSAFYGFFGGLLGGVIATLSLVIPSIIIIEIISGILKKFKESTTVKHIFYGLRPASTALVSASGMAIAKAAFLISNAETIAVNYKSLILFGVTLAGLKLFKLHPIVYIIFAAVIGIIFKF